MHDGNISLESEYGKGSEFIVELPKKLISQEVFDTDNCITPGNIEKIELEFSDIYL